MLVIHIETKSSVSTEYTAASQPPAGTTLSRRLYAFDSTSLNHPPPAITFISPLCLSPLCALHLLVAVLGLDEVGKSLGLGNLLGVVAVAVAVVLGSDVFHLVDAAALGASLHRTLLGKLRISHVHR